MAKVHVISDEKLGGVKREYVEVDRRAEVGDIAIQTSNWMGKRNNVDKITKVVDDDSGVVLGENALSHDEYKTLEPTDIVVIDGERFRMVDRKAEVDDLIIVSEMFEENNGRFYDVGHVGRVIKTGMDDVMVDFNGFYNPFVDSAGIWFIGNGNEGGYHVLEPVEDKSYDKQLDHSANLALRVVELERAVKR